MRFDTPLICPPGRLAGKGVRRVLRDHEWERPLRSAWRKTDMDLVERADDRPNQRPEVTRSIRRLHRGRGKSWLNPYRYYDCRNRGPIDDAFRYTPHMPS